MLSLLKNTEQPQGLISVILPCLNEEKGIGVCIESINRVAKENNLNIEIIVVDNGSTDKSKEIVRDLAQKFGKKNNNDDIQQSNNENISQSDGISIILEEEKVKGYGSAYIHGFTRATGKYIFMADADNTYDFSEIPRFVKKLEEGNDFVVGNRFAGLMEKNAMTFSHKWIGNPILSSLVRLFFKVKIHDIHCGARAITKESYNKLNLNTLGMEFASEMIIKAARAKLKITELPIKYSHRIGESKLETFKDGWRHLRFILLYSPIVIFLIPGILFVLAGMISMVLLSFGELKLWGIQLYFHPMFLSSLLIILGYELIFFTAFSRVYAVTHLNEKDKYIEKLFRIISLEKSLLIGSLITIFSIATYVIIFMGWISNDLKNLNETKNLIVALTFAILGIQTIMGSFMLSILGIKEKK